MQLWRCGDDVMAQDKKDKARKDYEAGMKYKDIATKYKVSLNTVKSWRSRNGWSRGAPEAKKGAPKKTERVHPKKTPKAVTESNATDKQKLFALLYLQSFNATKAYMQAYGVNYTTAMAAGSRLLGNAKVAAMIDALKNEQAAELHVTQMDVLRLAAKQMGADIGDYVEFGTESQIVRDGWYAPVKDKLTGDYLRAEVPYVHPKQSDEVDTSLIKSVHQGRDGIVIDLYDKQKAMDLLLKNLPDTGHENEGTVIIDDIPDE